jgi:Protein of unknown function (DUF998)
MSTTAQGLDRTAADCSPTIATNSPGLLAFGAIVGPLVFTLGWLVLGFISPGYTMWDIRVDHYSAISQPISGLGLGVTGPVMNALFVLTGLLLITGAVGVFRSIPHLSTRTRRVLSGLLALHGLGAILSGLFTLESFMAHFAGFALALSPIITFPIIARSLRSAPGWTRLARWLPIGSPITVALTILHFATFNPEAAGDGVGIAGLTQRMLLLELQAWIVAMGWLAVRIARGAYPSGVGSA